MPQPLSRVSRLPLSKPRNRGAEEVVLGISTWEHRLGGDVNETASRLLFCPNTVIYLLHWGRPGDRGIRPSPLPKTLIIQKAHPSPHGQVFTTGGSAHRQMEAETEASTPRTHLEGG